MKNHPRLSDIPDVRLTDQALIVPCQGKKADGSAHCCGMIRVPFEPTLNGAGKAPQAQRYWQRVSGETLDDITLLPSIDADACGHFHITNGAVVQ